MSFDLKVHHRDPKTGQITKITPYQYRVSKEHGAYFIRNGTEYWPNGTVKKAKGGKVEKTEPEKATK